MFYQIMTLLFYISVFHQKIEIVEAQVIGNLTPLYVITQKPFMLLKTYGIRSWMMSTFLMLNDGKIVKLNLN